MKPWTKATQRLSWAMLLIFVAGAILLLIPIWPEKLLWLYAILFWAPMIAAYVLYYLVNRWRRADQKENACPEEYRRPPGVLRLGRTTVTRVCGALAIAALVFMVVRVLMHKPAAFMDYVSAAIVFISAQFRAILAGRNWRYAKYKRLSRAKRRTGSKKKK